MMKTLFLFQVVTVTSDASFIILLGLIRYFLYILVTVLAIDNLKPVLDAFPKSIYIAKKIVGLHCDEFTQYVVCPKCHKLYDIDTNIRRCRNIQYPNHPRRKGRSSCGTSLFKKIRGTGNGLNVKFRPRKIYCHRSIKDSLELKFLQPNFRKLLKRNPKAESDGTFMTDITDGEICKTFKDNQSNLYFSNSKNLGFIMNVDWFQPFKNSDYSLGIIYLAIINLPREERFKWQNIIVCGVIPGPAEPKLNINSYLEPIVDELEIGWNGILLKDGGLLQKSLYKFALVCLSSDIPATRKCGGFVGFSATKGM